MSCLGVGRFRFDSAQHFEVQGVPLYYFQSWCFEAQSLAFEDFESSRFDILGLALVMFAFMARWRELRNRSSSAVVLVSPCRPFCFGGATRPPIFERGKAGDWKCGSLDLRASI